MTTTPKPEPASDPKPCPFCRARIELGRMSAQGQMVVHYGLAFSNCPFGEVAPREYRLAVWNARPLEEADRARIRELEGRLADLTTAKEKL